MKVARAPPSIEEPDGERTPNGGSAGCSGGGDGCCSVGGVGMYVDGGEVEGAVAMWCWDCGDRDGEVMGVTVVVNGSGCDRWMQRYP